MRFARTKGACRLLFVAVIMLSRPQTAAADPIWPSSSAYKELRSSGGFYSDDTSDVSPSWTDLVGNSTYSAGFWYYDESNGDLHFRLRLDTGPNANPQAVWQILFDSDTDTDVDWVLQLDLKTDNQVEFVTTSTGGPDFDDVALSATSTWTGAPSTWSDWDDPTGDSSQFNGNSDAFLNLAMPWSSFASATGLSKTDSFRIGLTTSTTHQSIIKDVPLGLGLSSSVDSAFGESITVTSVPEPATIGLFGAGLVGIWLLRARRGRRRAGTPA